MSESRFPVGYVAGVHGIAGALRIKLFDADSDAVAAGRTIELWREDTLLRTVSVVSANEVPGKPGLRRVQLDEIGNRNDAEALKGCEVRVDRDALPPLSDDEYYLADLVGAHVQEIVDGVARSLGEVTGISSNGVQDLLEIRWHDDDGTAHEWLLPALPQFIVELGQRRLVVDVPPGFMPDPLEARR